MVSAAQFDLTRRQRRWPPWSDLPWTPPDATNRATPSRLMRMLPTDAQVRLAAALAGRDYRIGELGLAAPNAETQPFPDGSVCIRLHGGLIDFVHAVARILFSGTSMQARGQPVVPAAAAPDLVSDRLGLLYQQWRGGQLWSGQRLQVEGFELPDQAANRAEHLAHTALLFVLCHETGHAVLHGAIAPEARNARHEHQADAYGIDLAIRGYGLGRSDVKMAIAGAVVAIRILAALQLLGHAFPGAHPSPLARLARLRWAMRRMCDSRRSYIEFTTIAYSFEEQMQAAELRIQRRTTVTDERLVSRLYAMLFEYARDQLSFERMLADFLDDMRSASRVIRARAGRSARMALSLDVPGWQDDHYRRMVAGLGLLVAALPPALRRDFTARESPADADP